MGVNSPPGARMDCHRQDHPLPTLPHRGEGIQIGLGTGQDLCVGRSHLGRIAEAQPNDPDFCLVRNIRRIDLESHRKPELVCGRDGGLCGICPVLTRTPHSPGRQQLLALGLRECWTPQAKSLGDGLILRRRLRRGHGKAIGQATLAPCMYARAGAATDAQQRLLENR